MAPLSAKHTDASADRVRLIEVTEAEYERCRIGASFAEGRCIG